MMKINAGSAMIPDHERPSFFKIIMVGHTDTHLRIPSQFLKHLSKDFINTATLKDPLGSHWNVILKWTTKGIYLEDGWLEFCKDHSLGDNEFLIFRYDGSVCFDVQIFDKNGCERPFASSDVRNYEESALPNRKGKRSRARKNVVEGRVKIETEEDLFWMKVKNENVTQMEIESKEIDHSISGKDLDAQTRRNRVMPLKAAESFTSELPYFKCTLFKSCVAEKYVLNIPVSFSKIQLPSFKTTIVLRNTKGKSWQANYIHTQVGKNYIGGGWAAFVHGNKLKIGDVCIFELMDRTELLVHIFR